MDTQNLKAFLLVAESGSFSLAAQKLHLTQPAVSKRVAQLEERLNCELFDRIGRSINLTEAGQALLPHAKAVQQELQAAEQSILDLAGDVGGKLRLATSHHIGLHRLPPMLSYFSKAYGAVSIDIDFMDSEQAYELIMQNKVELAIVTLAPTSEASIITIPVWQDPLDFMVQREHKLVLQPRLDLKALSQHPAILPGLNTYTGQIVKSLFDAHGLQLQVSMATNYLETVRMMASVGLGWTVLPRSMQDGSLATLPVNNARIETSVSPRPSRGPPASSRKNSTLMMRRPHGPPKPTSAIALQD